MSTPPTPDQSLYQTFCSVNQLGTISQNFFPFWPQWPHLLYKFVHKFTLQIYDFNFIIPRIPVTLVTTPEVLISPNLLGYAPKELAFLPRTLVEFLFFLKIIFRYHLEIDFAILTIFKNKQTT